MQKKNQNKNSNNEELNFEIEKWKNKKEYYVIRDDLGRFVSKVNKKKSGIRTKQQAREKFKQDKTLSKNKIKLKGKKGTKYISKDKYISASRVGLDTWITTSETPFRQTQQTKRQNQFQVQASLRVDKSNEFKGFSSKEGTLQQKKIQAFNNALSQAIDSKLINYDWKHEQVSDTSGFFISKSGKKAVGYQVRYTYLKYIYTKSLEQYAK